MTKIEKIDAKLSDLGGLWYYLELNEDFVPTKCMKSLIKMNVSILEGIRDKLTTPKFQRYVSKGHFCLLHLPGTIWIDDEYFEDGCYLILGKDGEIIGVTETDENGDPEAFVISHTCIGGSCPQNCYAAIPIYVFNIDENTDTVSYYLEVNGVPDQSEEYWMTMYELNSIYNVDSIH